MSDSAAALIALLAAVLVLALLSHPGYWSHYRPVPVVRPYLVPAPAPYPWYYPRR